MKPRRMLSGNALPRWCAWLVLVLLLVRLLTFLFS